MVRVTHSQRKGHRNGDPEKESRCQAQATSHQASRSTDKLTVSVSARIVKAVALGLSYRYAATAGGVHEKTLESWRARGARELNSNSIYARFIGRIDRAAEKTAISYLEAVRLSIMESPVKVREHIKKDESGKVILTEIHRETLPPDIRGAMWWLERRFPEQFGRRDQMEHSGKVKVNAVQTQERKLTIELVNSEGEVHRLTRDDVMKAAVTVETVEPEP